MKKQHRKAHLFVWLIVTPILLFSIYNALQGRFDIDESYAPSDSPVEGVAL